MEKFNDLYDFISTAAKQRKYPENTANGHRAALRVFEKALKPEEKDSLDVLEKNAEAIYRDVINNNKDKFSLGSLSTYKIRFMRVINDYKKYGIDPSKMQNWNPKLRKVVKSHPTKEDMVDNDYDTTNADASKDVNSPVHKIDLTLRPGKRFIISIPTDITKSEAEIIKNLINSLVANKDEQAKTNN